MSFVHHLGLRTNATGLEAALNLYLSLLHFPCPDKFSQGEKRTAATITHSRFVHASRATTRQPYDDAYIREYWIVGMRDARKDGFRQFRLVSHQACCWRRQLSFLKIQRRPPPVKGRRPCNAHSHNRHLVRSQDRDNSSSMKLMRKESMPTRYHCRFAPIGCQLFL